MNPTSTPRYPAGDKKRSIAEWAENASFRFTKRDTAFNVSAAGNAIIDGTSLRSMLITGFLVFTVSTITASQTVTAPAQTSYWNTAHYEVWNHSVLPPSNIPWGSITHLIHFCGGTGGNGTTSSNPYYQPQSGIEIDGGVHIGDSLRAIGHRNGVGILLDLGLNWSFLNTWNDATMATWAHTIANYIQGASYGGYDGADMDVEGSLAGVQAKIGRAGHILHDTLTALGQRMGKKLYLTCDVLSSFDATYMAPTPDSIMYFDQCNLMSYDMYGTFGSPLYSETGCGVSYSDSSLLQPWIDWFNSHYGAAGVAKIGMGYNIQIYQTSKTTPCPAGSFGLYSGWSVDSYSAQSFSGGTNYWDNTTKEPYLINTTLGVLIAYEDTNSVFWKADFIKRKGLGGAMGFCLGRGYIPPNIATQYNIRDGNGNLVNPNMAAYGMGKGLNGTITTPSAPALISPLNSATNQPVSPILNWSQVLAASTYRLQVSLSATFNSTVFDDSTLTGTSSQIGPLQYNQSYYWRVNARNASGTSPYSVVWSFRTFIPTPSPPVLSSPLNGSVAQQTTLTLSWSASANANSYRAQVATDSGFSSVILDDSTISGTSRQIGPLLNVKKYFWRVNAKDDGGTSSFSAIWNFTTVDTLPSTPVLISPFSGAVIPSAGCPASWEQSQHANSYRIQIATDGSFGNVILDDSILTATSTVIGPFPKDTTYYWRVCSGNHLGKSPWSDAQNFITNINATTVSVSLIDGWNLLSVPLLTSNRDLNILFPTAISPGFYYNNGYTITDTLVNGKGFWLKFDGSRDMLTSGYHVRSDTIDVQRGWNIIGSIDTSIVLLTDSVTSIPGNIIISRLFGYNGAYYLVDTLKSGYGYYVRVNQDGKLVLRNPLSPGRAMLTSVLPKNMGVLELRDALGKTQKLYVGLSPKIKNLIQTYELPPVPPPGGFDVRFSGNRMLETVDNGVVGEFSVILSSAHYPVIVSWHAPSSQTRATLLSDGQELMLDERNSVHLDNSSTSILLKVHNPLSRPLASALEQNYPNPFNPTTRVRFTLAAPGFVSLKIYNLLGQEIATLLSDYKPEGEYAIEWNAAALPSGVYFYRISSGNFVSVKKMSLMK